MKEILAMLVGGALAIIAAGACLFYALAPATGCGGAPFCP